MAEVTHRLGKGAYNFAQKTRRCYLLQSQNERWKNVTHASSVSTEFLPAETQNGAGNTDDGGTVAASRESHSRVTRLFAADIDALTSIKDASPADNTKSKTLERSYANFPGSSCSFGRLQSLTARLPCWGHGGQFVFIRGYSGNGARDEPLYKTKTGYYEILEVLPSATQAQIKTAYYKQSFIYHPDRNAGNEVGTVRFSEINEAYSVLGNKALRKKYDRGVLSQADLLATAKPSGKESAGSSSKQQPDTKRSAMGPAARGGIYDFDSFYKAHYSDQLQKEKDRKAQTLRKKQEKEGLREETLDRTVELTLVFMVFVVLLLFCMKRN